MGVDSVHLYLHWVLPALAVVSLCAFADSGWRALRETDKRTIIGLVALTSLGLLIRLWMAPGGWGDQRATLTSTFAGGPTLDGFGTYGRGVEATFGPLFSAFGWGPVALERLSLFAGALTPALLFAVMRGLGLGEAASWFAAVCVALTPLHVRYSPTLNRYVIGVALWSAAAAMLLWQLGESRRRLLPLIGGACALAWACQCRPDMMWLPALVALIPWTQRLQRSQRLSAWTVTLISGSLLALPAWNLLERVMGAQEWLRFTEQSQTQVPVRGLLSSEHNLIFCDIYTPSLWAVCAIWGACLGLAKPPNRRAVVWLLLWAIVGAAIPGTSDISKDLLSARYHLMAWPAWAGLIGLGAASLAHALGGSRNAYLVALGCLTLTPWPQMRYANRVTTQDQEVAFLREHLRAVPDGCLVVAYQPEAQDLGLRPSSQLSLYAGRRHRWVERWQPETTHRSERCAVLYRGTGCEITPSAKSIYSERRQICVDLKPSPERRIAHAVLTADTIGSHQIEAWSVAVSLSWLRDPRRSRRDLDAPPHDRRLPR